jgi:hypothetical protein
MRRFREHLIPLAVHPLILTDRFRRLIACWCSFELFTRFAIENGSSSTSGLHSASGPRAHVNARAILP